MSRTITGEASEVMEVVLFKPIHRSEGTVKVFQGGGVSVVRPREKPSGQVLFIKKEVIQRSPEHVHDTGV